MKYLDLFAFIVWCITTPVLLLEMWAGLNLFQWSCVTMWALMVFISWGRRVTTEMA